MTSRTRDAVEFDGAVDHLFLKFGNLAELAAGGDDQLEFVGRVDRASAAVGLRAEQRAAPGRRSGA